MNLGDIVTCIWLDHASHTGWVSVDDASDFKLVRVATTGYFVSKDSGGLRIALSYDKDNKDVSDVLVIGEGSIVNLKSLEDLVGVAE